MAGSWSSVSSSRGSINGAPSPVHEQSKSFTDDATTPSIPDVSFPSISGFLVGSRVAFGSPAPNTVTLVIKDKNGVTLANGTFTSSGAFEIDNAIPFSEGLTISGSGNTTVSAKFTVYVYVI